MTTCLAPVLLAVAGAVDVKTVHIHTAIEALWCVAAMHKVTLPAAHMQASTVPSQTLLLWCCMCLSCRIHQLHMLLIKANPQNSATCSRQHSCIRRQCLMWRACKVYHLHHRSFMQARCENRTSMTTHVCWQVRM